MICNASNILKKNLEARRMVSREMSRLESLNTVFSNLFSLFTTYLNNIGEHCYYKKSSLIITYPIFVAVKYLNPSIKLCAILPQLLHYCPLLTSEVTEMGKRTKYLVYILPHDPKTRISHHTQMMSIISFVAKCGQMWQ